MTKYFIKLIYDIFIKSGGVTFNPIYKTINPSSGYMVSFEGLGIVTDYPELQKDFEFDLENYLTEDIWDLIADSRYYIGIWLNNHQVYFDISYNYSSLEEAIEIGKHNNQIAIWDCNKKIEITL